MPTTGIDMYMGSGGAPEGVLAAAALKCMGGQIWGRLLFRNDDERGRAAKAGITDLDRIYARDDMVTEDVIFAATGVTDGVAGAGRQARARLVDDRNSSDALQNRVGAAHDLPQPGQLTSPAPPLRGAAAGVEYIWTNERGNCMTAFWMSRRH